MCPGDECARAVKRPWWRLGRRNEPPNDHSDDVIRARQIRSDRSRHRTSQIQVAPGSEGMVRRGSSRLSHPGARCRLIQAHQRSITSYVLAFGQPAEQRTARLSPSALGHKGPVYAYNYFDGYGMHLQPGQAVEFAVPDDGAYWIVVPLGPSGVGFLGDSGKFVSNGRKRVARIMDTGVLTARVIFSAGERRLRFYGFSLARPKVRATGAIIAEPAYDSRTSLFHFDLVARPGTSPVVTLRAAVNPKTALVR